MASTHKHIRSSTADKRPTTAIADGQIALNTNVSSPGLFFKDSTGATIIKVGPVHVGTTAPNAVPAAGGSSGNSAGEVWLDTSLTPPGVKIWNGSAWVNATPTGSTTAQGLLELATDAETQAGSDAARAVTPASLQSKISDSTSTTSSTTIASSTAVKAAYDLANAAVPTSGGTVTGNLEIGSTGSLSFEGSTIDGFETSIAITDPTADRVITLPDTTGTVVTTGDSGTVTSAMIANGTIVDGDISATAEIAVSKLADGAARQLLQTDAAGTGVEWTSNVDIPGTLDVTGVATFDSTAAHPLGSAAAPTITFTGDPNTGLYSPGADQVAISTAGTGRLFVDASGNVNLGQLSSALQSGGTGLTVYGSTSSEVKFLNSTVGALSTDGTALVATGVDFSVNNREAGSLVFGTSNTERLRIDSSGRLLVGTSTARSNIDSLATQLQIEGTSEAGSALSITRNVNTSGCSFLYLNKTRGSAIGQNTIVQANDIIGILNYGAADGTNIVPAASIKGEVDGTPGTNDMPGRLVFSTTADGTSSPTERMRITNSGNVGIGATSITNTAGFGRAVEIAGTFPALTLNQTNSGFTTRKYSLGVDSSGNLNVWDNDASVYRASITTAGHSKFTTDGTFVGGNLHEFVQTINNTESLYLRHKGTSPYGMTIAYTGGAPNNTVNSFLYCFDGSVRADIRSNGGLANYQANNVNLSDINAKKDISLALSTWNCIKQWEIVNYRYKDQPEGSDLSLGVIAQQVAQSCPEVITVFQEAKEATEDQPAQEERLGVKEQQMYWMAIKTLQEAMERIETLEAKVAALEGA